MSTTLTANFDTRREAEMTVERLVQEYGIARTDIFVGAAGDTNSAGIAPAGSDTRAGEPSPANRDDAALNGAITVSVDLADAALAARVRDTFGEFSAQDVAEN